MHKIAHVSRFAIITKLTSFILEDSSENIEKCKSLRILGEVNFAIIANRDMGSFVHFWQFFRLSIHN